MQRNRVVAGMSPQYGDVLKLNYAVEQRLRLIDFLVSNYDSVGREQLVDFFGISLPQATRDFRTYRQIAPGNLVFDDSTKRYRKSSKFERVYP